jgi:hypothetical protein
MLSTPPLVGRSSMLLAVVSKITLADHVSYSWLQQLPAVTSTLKIS